MDMDETAALGWEHDAAMLRERLMGAGTADDPSGSAGERIRRHLLESLHYRSIEAEMQVRDDVPRLLAELARATEAG
jgi:hypothetical protein